MEARDVLIAPMITEKSMTGTAYHQYTFEVHPRATKTQIRKAIEEVFGVTVRKVNTIQVGGKHKSFARKRTRTVGRQADWKKAIITLAPGEKIELAGVNYFEQ